MRDASHTHPPPLFSVVRITNFLTCILVALASGTNYVFSAYGPQLGARLSLSHTQINIVGLSGNIGVYGTAPIWGGIVDRRGPQIMMVIAFFALLTGYLGIRHFFDTGLPIEGDSLSLAAFCLLVFFGFLTGIGGNGGLVGSMNATAKSWPDRTRATANGIVISGFGLSAFLFSSIAHTLFPGNTSDFLLMLAIGTSLPMILGFLFVRPIPPPHIDSTSRLEHATADDASDYGVADSRGSSSPTIYSAENTSHTHLLVRNDEDEDEDEPQRELPIELERGGEEPLHAQMQSEYVVPGSTDSLMLSPHTGLSRQRSHGARSLSRRSGRGHLDRSDGVLNIHGKRLFKTVDFWLLFVTSSLLSGTGLMYINNVGAISQALFAYNNPDYDEVKAAQWQAAQVSTISIMNCIGRIGIGIIADFTKGKLRLPRSFCLIVVAMMFVISQVVCYHIEDIGNLWKASTLLGLAYGGLFGLFPTLTIEWFGLAHFSENWGFVSLSPMLCGNVFSIMFGRDLDSHDVASNTTLPAALASVTHTSTINAVSTAALLTARGIPSPHHCAIGRECYVNSLTTTTIACCVALGLGVYASWRDLRKQKGATGGRAEGGPTVVIWDSEE